MDEISKFIEKFRIDDAEFNTVLSLFEISTRSTNCYRAFQAFQANIQSFQLTKRQRIINASWVENVLEKRKTSLKKWFIYFNLFFMKRLKVIYYDQEREWNFEKEVNNTIKACKKECFILNSNPSKPTKAESFICKFESGVSGNLR